MVIFAKGITGVSNAVIIATRDASVLVVRKISIQ